MSQIYVVLVEYVTFFDVLMVFYYHSPFNVVCCMKIKKIRQQRVLLPDRLQ